MRSDNVHFFCGETPALSTPSDVVTYLQQTEAGVPFRHPVPKEEKGYHARIKQPIDLGTIARRARDGVYAEAPVSEEEIAASSSSAAAAARGIEGLWEDLKLMITNAKKFNQRECFIWRLADALELEIRRLRKAYAPLGSGGGAVAAAGGSDDVNAAAAAAGEHSSSSSSGASVSGSAVKPKRKKQRMLTSSSSSSAAAAAGASDVEGEGDGAAAAGGGYEADGGYDVSAVKKQKKKGKKALALSSSSTDADVADEGDVGDSGIQANGAGGGDAADSMAVEAPFGDGDVSDGGTQGPLRRLAEADIGTQQQDSFGAPDAAMSEAAAAAAGMEEEGY